MTGPSCRSASELLSSWCKPLLHQEAISGESEALQAGDEARSDPFLQGARLFRSEFLLLSGELFGGKYW